MKFLILAVIASLALAADAQRAVGEAAALFRAAETGDVAMLNRLLAANPALADAKEAFDERPLFRAVQFGQLDAVRILLKAGADPNSGSTARGSALGHAAAAGELEIVNELLGAGAMVNVRDRMSNPPLYLSSEKGHLKIVKVLLEAKALVNQRGAGGVTPLMGAARGGFEDVVDALLAASAEIDARDDRGMTAIEYAMQRGQTKLVRRLIERGATPGASLGEPRLTAEEVKDAARLNERLEALSAAFREFLPAVAIGDVKRVSAIFELYPKIMEVTADPQPMRKTPIMHAIESGKAEMVELLLKRGATMSYIGPSIDPGPGQLAIRRGDKALLELLVRNGLPLNSERRGADKTLLCYAVELGDKSMVEALIALGADVNAASWPDESPLHTAARRGDVEIAKVLLANKARLSGADRRGTPLGVAAAMGHKAFVEFLLNGLVDVKIANSGANTALQAAAAAGHTDIVKLLVDKGVEMDLSALIALDKPQQVAEMVRKDPVLLAKPSPTGSHPLHLAVLLGRGECVKALLDAGANVNGADSMGSTPLHAAAVKSNVELVRLFLERKADVNARDRYGDTPLDKSNQGRGTDVADLLKAAGGKSGRELPKPEPPRGPRGPGA